MEGRESQDISSRQRNCKNDKEQKEITKCRKLRTSSKNHQGKRDSLRPFDLATRENPENTVFKRGGSGGFDQRAGRPLFFLESIESRKNRRVWIRISCTLLRGVARPYVTTHVPGFCGRGMPRRRFVWIGGYPPMDGGPADCYTGRRPSGSFRLISYETRRDRLITVEFVAQLYRRPLRPRMNVGERFVVVVGQRWTFLSSSQFSSADESVVHSLPGNSSKACLRTLVWLPLPFFGDKSAPCSPGLIGSFATNVPLRRRSTDLAIVAFIELYEETGRVTKRLIGNYFPGEFQRLDVIFVLEDICVLNFVL